jgi:GNAT superfamily N-acetyltransferase
VELEGSHAVTEASPPLVRPATVDDAPHLAQLSGQLGYPVAVDTIAARLARLLDRTGDVVLVAEANGEVVGWVHGSEQALLESATRCELLGLVVDARHRTRGIGRRLVAAVESWAEGRGLQLVSVRSNVSRTESHPFYERLGYSRVKTQHAYRKRLDPPA